MGEMFEVIPSVSNFEREEQVVAAAQHIVRLLQTHRKADDDLRRILAELDAKLSSMKISGEVDVANDLELVNKTRDGKLRSAEAKIKCWLSNHSMVWESEPVAFMKYLKAVDEVQCLVRDASCQTVNNSSRCWEEEDREKFLLRSENILHNAMERLEDELKDILSHCCFLTCEVIPAAAASSSPPCCEEDKGTNSMIGAAEDESSSTSSVMGGSSRRESCSIEESDDHHHHQYVADMVRSDMVTMVPIIKSIADVMFASNYSREFSDMFIKSQKDALDELLIDLGIERFSIEEVIRMDWNLLDGKIRTWVRVIKTFISVYLTAERHLCDQIFEEFVKEEEWNHQSHRVFAEITTPSISTFLTFGQGVAIAPRAPEKLFSLLNMYEALSGLLQEDYMVGMFMGGTSSELQELLTRLGQSAKATFLEFGDIILSNPSTDAFPAGRVHPITKYVMNYVKTLDVYTFTLNFLLQDHDSFEVDVGKKNHSQANYDDEDQDTSKLQSHCPLAHHLRSTVDKLVQNLSRKSQLYRDVSLGHFFLLNNTHYIVQKMSGSELQPFLGDSWIKQKISAYYQHANKYDRASWSSVLDLLKSEGGSSSSNSKRNALRDQLRCFTSAFEDIYKTQTGWLVRDEQLKSELRIKITQNLILAYQNFYRRCKDHNLENYIKYEPEDLINLVSDLFEGSTKSLSNSYRR